MIPRRWRRRGRRPAAFTGKVAAWLLLVLLLLYLVHLGTLLSRLRNHGRLPKLRVNCVDEDTVALVGKSQPAYKASSACRYEANKPPGVTRIGCFGDSFTYSFEVADGLDYPALLGRLFEQHGHPEVQVLNFGNDWTGFHQSWILFERIGLRYGLDAAVFGPLSVYRDRDSTFCHAQDESPGYIHARYVLDGDGVRLLRPRGGRSFHARFFAHHALIPSWQRLRYDILPPAALQALLPPGLRTRIANPFYYLSAAERAQETETIQRRLLASAPHEVKLTVGLYDVGFAQWLGREHDGGGDDVFAGVTEQQGFPYKSAGFHNSPTGNLLLAAQYHNLLALTDPVPLTVIETRTLEPTGPVAAADRPLSAYERVVVELDGQPAGGFVGIIPPFMGGIQSEEKERAWQRGEIDTGSLPRSGAASLLALLPAGQSVLDAAFLPLSFPLRNDAPVTVRCEGGDPAGEPLGTVTLLSPHLGQVQLEGRYQALHARRDAWTLTASPPPGCSDPRGATILVDGQPVMTVEASPTGLELLPEDHGLLLLRAVGDVLLEPEPGENGPVDLVLIRNGEEPEHHAIASWSSRPLRSSDSSQPIGQPP